MAKRFHWGSRISLIIFMFAILLFMEGLLNYESYYKPEQFYVISSKNQLLEGSLDLNKLTRSMSHFCGSIDGVNELRQLKKYSEYVRKLKHTVMNIHRNESNAKFKYKVLIRNEEPLMFTVCESHQGAPTFGGASFRVELHEYMNKDEHLRLCRVTDHFNGNYTVCCPLQTSNWTVFIYLMYTNYNAYFDRVSDAPLLKLIWKNDSQNTDVQLKSVDMITYRLCEDIGPPGVRGHWMKRNNSWRWTRDNGCILQLLEPQQITKCLSRVHSLTYAGASHMRNTQEYTVTFLPVRFQPKKRLPLKHGSTRQRNILYIKTLVLSKLPDLIKNMTRFLNIGGNHKSKDIFAYQTGAHNLNRISNISNFMFNQVPNAIKFLEKEMKNPVWKKTRKIIFSPIPFPQTTTRFDWKNKRNNFVIAALRAALVPNLRKLGFEIVDVFDIIVPRNMESADKVHYVLTRRISVPGMAYLQLSLSQICRPYLQ